MTRCTVFSSTRYEVVSYGSGLSYSVTRIDGASLFFQGDDAARFRAERDAWEAARPTIDSDRFYDNLMREYGEATP